MERTTIDLQLGDHTQPVPCQLLTLAEARSLALAGQVVGTILPTGKFDMKTRRTTLFHRVAIPDGYSFAFSFMDGDDEIQCVERLVVDGPAVWASFKLPKIACKYNLLDCCVGTAKRAGLALPEEALYFVASACWLLRDGESLRLDLKDLDSRLPSGPVYTSVEDRPNATAASAKPAAEAVWKSRKGEMKFTQMTLSHLENAAKQIERQLPSTTNALSRKNKIRKLWLLKAEIVRRLEILTEERRIT